MEKAIEVQGLRKSYGQIEAVRDIDFYVEKGKFFAFWGPMVRVRLRTIGYSLHRPQSGRGSARINGHELGRRMVKSAPPSALSFRGNYLDDLLTVKENL